MRLNVFTVFALVVYFVSVLAGIILFCANALKATTKTSQGREAAWNALIWFILLLFMAGGGGAVMSSLLYGN